jgi:hypothetical protein
MIDLTDAVHTAVFAALAGIAGPPVYSVAPEETLPPYIIIGDNNVDPTIGGKAGVLERHELTIVTVFAGGSKRPMLAAQRAVRTALEGATLLADGASLSRPVQLSSNDRIDPTSGVIVGEQTMLIFAQTLF